MFLFNFLIDYIFTFCGPGITQSHLKRFLVPSSLEVGLAVKSFF